MPHRPPRWEEPVVRKPWQQSRRTATAKLDRINEIPEMLRYALYGREFFSPKYQLRGKSYAPRGEVRGFTIYGDGGQASNYTDPVAHYHKSDDKWFVLDPVTPGWLGSLASVIHDLRQALPDAITISLPEMFVVQRDGVFGLAEHRVNKPRWNEQSMTFRWTDTGRLTLTSVPRDGQWGGTMLIMDDDK